MSLLTSPTKTIFVFYFRKEKGMAKREKVHHKSNNPFLFYCREHYGAA
jgi:hypothetical protein